MPDSKKKIGQEDVPYSRADYRRLVAWPQRIRREAPFLRKILEQSPARIVLDLGCGSGEHCRFFSAEGFRAVGLDRSESMLAKAQQEALPETVEFKLGNIQTVDKQVQREFGAAISLGNTLVHLMKREELERTFVAIAQVLITGGIFLFQILNYERIFQKNIRYLPLNFQKTEDGERIFLRLMEVSENGIVRFCPTTLKYNPKDDPAVELLRSRIVELRGWQHNDLVPPLKKSGFRILATHGDMEGGPFEPLNSQDLVLVARLDNSPP